MDLTENQATMVDNADEIQNDLVPSNYGNERIQCTMTQVSDNSQLPEVPASKDTFIINTIKHPGNCSELNAFDIRRFMSNAQPPKDSDTQAEANASYDPVPSSQNEVTPSSTGKSKSKFHVSSRRELHLPLIMPLPSSRSSV